MYCSVACSFILIKLVGKKLELLLEHHADCNKKTDLIICFNYLYNL